MMQQPQSIEYWISNMNLTIEKTKQGYRLYGTVKDGRKTINVDTTHTSKKEAEADKAELERVFK